MEGWQRVNRYKPFSHRTFLSECEEHVHYCRNMNNHAYTNILITKLITMVKKNQDDYNENLIRWVKVHHWDSLEKDKALILRHLRTFAGDKE